VTTFAFELLGASAGLHRKEKMTNSELNKIVTECSRRSDDSSMSFGEVLQKLMAAGIERYHQDFMRAERTYYLSDGDSAVVAHELAHPVPAKDFSSAGVEAAVRAVQSGAINYKQFCERVTAAGCVGYFVSIVGKRVVYYGRTCDSHVEWVSGCKMKRTVLRRLGLSAGGEDRRSRGRRPKWSPIRWP
jgi:uncharacterized protein YbcV (DUF1398 family)